MCVFRPVRDTLTNTALSDRPLAPVHRARPFCSQENIANGSGSIAEAGDGGGTLSLLFWAWPGATANVAKRATVAKSATRLDTVRAMLFLCTTVSRRKRKNGTFC